MSQKREDMTFFPERDHNDTLSGATPYFT